MSTATVSVRVESDVRSVSHCHPVIQEGTVCCSVVVRNCLVVVRSCQKQSVVVSCGDNNNPLQ